MAFRLDVPSHLYRNSHTVSVDGYEETGLFLIDLATQRLGLTSLADSDGILDSNGLRDVQLALAQGCADAEGSLP